MALLEIIGNVLSFIALTLFFISSFLKRKRNILLFQTGNHIIGSVGEILLKQYSGVVQEVISIIRNALLLFNKNNKIISAILINLGLFFGVLFNILFNDNNIWGYLPVFASFEYSIVVLIPNVKVKTIKLSMIVSSICWLIYGVIFKNYAMAFFNLITLASTIISLIRIIRKKEE